MWYKQILKKEPSSSLGSAAVWGDNLDVVAILVALNELWIPWSIMFFASSGMKWGTKPNDNTACM